LRFPVFRLQHQIFFYYSLLIILSTILFGYYAYHANVRTAEENFTTAISGSLAQTGRELAGLLREAESQANLFAGSAVVQDALSPDNVGVIQQYDRYIALERLIDAYEKNFEAFGIRVFFESPRRFLNDRVRYFTVADREGPDSAGYWFARNSATYWTLAPPETASARDGVLFTVYRSVFSQTDIGVTRGSVAFDVKREAIAAVAEALPLPGGRLVALVDDKGRELLAGGAVSDSRPRLGGEALERLRSADAGSVQRSGTDGPMLTIFQKIGSYPLYAVVDVPMSDISNRSKTIMQQFLVVALLVVGASFVVSYFISRGVTKRLKRLTTVMGKVESHDFNIRVPVGKPDEIGVLTGKFNWMIERIRALIEDVYKSNYEKKEAELKLLQAQINPHFLYNALDSVHWLAVRHQAPDISYMVRNLSDFLRLSLHVDGDSTLGKELRHGKAYVNIQNYRFEDRIELVDEVPSSLYDVEVAPLLLQPLIENAILHGILDDDGRKGIIVVRAFAAEGVVTVEVADNGAGMDEERRLETERMLDKPWVEGEGTGLRNVYRRLRFRYDGDAGMTIRSAKGEGTRIALRFPERRASPRPAKEEGEDDAEASRLPEERRDS